MKNKLGLWIYGINGYLKNLTDKNPISEYYDYMVNNDYT